MWSVVICELRIHQFRNLQQASLSLARCNLILGKNGSGKTSLLEAVFLLSRGRSFRHHEPKRFISHHQKQCAVWARLAGEPSCTLAIQKTLDTANKSETLLKLNDMPVGSQGLISQKLSVMLIDPSSMSVLDEGSTIRRQMLDWLVFHVKPEFYPEWLAYQRLLKQRNSLLKQPSIKHRQQEIYAWDKQLAYYAQVLHRYREEVFLLWQQYFGQMLSVLLPDYEQQITLNYQVGFDVKIPLDRILFDRLEQDIELGYTRVGSHRADVLVVFRHENDGQKIKEQAANVLSRGEKKLLIAALKVSQLQVLCQLSQNSNHSIPTPVVLIDDIDAELDEWAVQTLLKAVLPLSCQVVISSLNADIQQQINQILLQNHIEENLTDEVCKVFHVEQGVFRCLTDEKSAE